MRLGIFPLVCMAAWVMVLPGCVWDGNLGLGCGLAVTVKEITLCERGRCDLRAGTGGDRAGGRQWVWLHPCFCGIRMLS